MRGGLAAKPDWAGAPLADRQDAFEQLKTKSGIWFHDVRRSTNHPHPLRDWYRPEGLKELLAQDAAEDHVHGADVGEAAAPEHPAAPGKGTGRLSSRSAVRGRAGVRWRPAGSEGMAS